MIHLTRILASVQALRLRLCRAILDIKGQDDFHSLLSLRSENTNSLLPPWAPLHNSAKERMLENELFIEKPSYLRRSTFAHRCLSKCVAGR